MDKPEGGRKTQGRFGSFSGVFTPNALTILGLILFLRTGWTVGQAGLAGALLIIGLANAISFLTGLSISAVATNMRVKTGGAYYMISRSLGLEIGGAIGIPLYLSQAISVAFYIIGFTEALTLTFPFFPSRTVSVVLVLFFGFLAYIGAHFIIRIQFVILTLLALALLSFFSGTGEVWLQPTLTAAAEPPEGFWQVFAVFFPAVTGIMVGVSMSGDLKDPGRDIPRGTLSSILTTGVIYATAAVWLSLHAEPQTLRGDPLVMMEIARWPQLVLLGVWAATLSSALGSVLAAPRTLQALAFDQIVPRFVSLRLGSATEPRMAVLITTALALVVVFLGQLNFVATLITMFFLNTYGMINLTAGLERLIGNPSFRSRFRVPWVLSLLGGFGCYAAMFLIHPSATVIAVVISYGIYFLLKRIYLRQRWGDLRTGFWFATVRFGLLRLQSLPIEPKNWRPNIVAFTGIPGTSQEREPLTEMAAWLSRGGGIVTLSHLLVGNLEEMVGKDYRQTARKRMQRYLREQGVAAFGECVIVPEFFQGVLDIAQAHGIVSTEANTILLGWARKPEIQQRQLTLLSELVDLKKSALFLHYNAKRGYGNHRRMDIWWRGRDRNAQLMLLLAHIICKSNEWENADIRVVRLLETEEGRRQAENHLAGFLKGVRVAATPAVLVKEHPDEPFADALLRCCADTDLILLGLPQPRRDQAGSRAQRLRKMLQPLPSTLLVRSAEIENILEAESNQGQGT